MTSTTATAESEGSGSVDVKQWLKENKLTEVEKIFLEREVSIEELTDFNENDLLEFGKDIGLDTLQRKRFVKAIQKLQINKTSVNANVNPNVNNNVTMLNRQPSSQSSTNNFGTQNQQQQPQLANKPTQVIVSPEEHEAISKLYQKYDESGKLILQLEASFENIEKSANGCQENVKKSFDELTQVLTSKKEDLLKEVDIIKNEKRTKLLTQLDLLAKHSKMITEGKEKYEQLITDQSMDSNKRKTTILTMIDNILRDSNTPLVLTTQPKITFPVNPKQIEKFFEGLAIDDCDQPFSPVLTIKKNIIFICVSWMESGRKTNRTSTKWSKTNIGIFTWIYKNSKR